MKIYIKKIVFINRAPFSKLELDFEEDEIAILSAVNGRGKTTVLSHIVDSLYEIARPHFWAEFEGRQDKYYRISSPHYSLNQSSPSIFYIRFLSADRDIDYVDIRGECVESQYDDLLKIENKIPYHIIKNGLSQNYHSKYCSLSLDKEKTMTLFNSNILTYLPAYRFELPGYLNDPYKIKIEFRKESRFSGLLNNPIEVITGLPQLANWILDIVLDMQMNHDKVSASALVGNLNNLISKTLLAKNRGQLRVGIGPRGFGSTRIQIVESSTGNQVYPNIFNMSSGENAVFCLFGELLRQADNIRNNVSLGDVSGVVLIDEVDKHLHIKMQKEVLPYLFNLFPKVQFVVSSHSPFLSMGLAEVALERTKIIDLENGGITKDPVTNELYSEVYDMMINENARFKNMYDDLQCKIEPAKKLQIITEGKNVAHIEKAIEVLDSTLFDNVNIVKGAEDRSGDQQLKNAFEIMSKGNHVGSFLFVWDCDSKAKVDVIAESANFFKFVFEKNIANTIAEKGIENLYPPEVFQDDVYDSREVPRDYGGSSIERSFNKAKFVFKIKSQTDTQIFKNYAPLIDKIKELIK